MELLFVKIKEDADLTVSNIILNNEQSFAVPGEKVTKAVFDVRHLQFTHISKEVLNYVADSPFGKYQESEAFIISGLGQKLMANFYLKVVKPKVNSKFLQLLILRLSGRKSRIKMILFQLLRKSLSFLKSFIR
jgi:hypothetical protein